MFEFKLPYNQLLMGVDVGGSRHAKYHQSTSLTSSERAAGGTDAVVTISGFIGPLFAFSAPLIHKFLLYVMDRRWS